MFCNYVHFPRLLIVVSGFHLCVYTYLALCVPQKGPIYVKYTFSSINGLSSSNLFFLPLDLLLFTILGSMPSGDGPLHIFQHHSRNGEKQNFTDSEVHNMFKKLNTGGTLFIFSVFNWSLQIFVGTTRHRTRSLQLVCVQVFGSSGTWRSHK